jgi:hypothetical protein
MRFVKNRIRKRKEKERKESMKRGDEDRKEINKQTKTKKLAAMF